MAVKKRSMQRLAPLSDRKWPKSLESLRGGFATELNVYRVMAHHPALLRAWTTLRNHVTHGSQLSPRWRELAILRTARFVGSRYEWLHHLERGRAAGLSEAEIASVALSKPWKAFAPADRVLLRTTDALHRGFGLSDRQLVAAANHMSAQQMLDLMVTVGMYCTLGFIVKSFDTPLEQRFSRA